jgi:hypothetical protein
MSKNKNERLLDALGEVSPIFVKEAAPGNLPHKGDRRGSHYVYLRKRSLVSMVACMVMALAMMFAFGFSASALTYDRGEDSPPPQTTGTLLTSIPRVITAQDYEELCAILAYNLENVPNGQGIYKRCTAYYGKQSLADLKTDKAKEMLLKTHPITQLTDVYVLDSEVTDVEENAILCWLMYYGGLNQEKLIDIYQTLYDLVEGTDLTRQEKAAIKKTLPEIPSLPIDVPEMDIEMLIKLAREKGKSLPSPAALPIIMTEADYNAMVARMFEKAGVEHYEDAPHAVKRIMAYYAKFDASDGESDYEELLAPLLKVSNFYVMDIDTTLYERSYLCAAMAYYADIWAEDAHQITQNFHAVIDESDEPDKQRLHGMVNDIFAIIREQVNNGQ